MNPDHLSAHIRRDLLSWIVIPLIWLACMVALGIGVLLADDATLYGEPQYVDHGQIAESTGP